MARAVEAIAPFSLSAKFLERCSRISKFFKPRNMRLFQSVQNTFQAILS